MSPLTPLLSKSRTYLLYFWEYLIYADLPSIRDSLNYLLFRKSNREDRIVRSRIGKFYCRKNTTDFMYVNHRYEHRVKKFIIDRLDQYDTFMDVGACIGDYSIWLQGKGYKCLAFEPVPTNYHSLLMNKDLNSIQDGLHVYNIGLGETEEIVQFEVREDNKGASKVLRGVEAEDQNSGQIYPLDSIIQRLPISSEDRIIAKLDVEGYEMEVLKGASKFIREQENLMLIIEIVLSDRSAMIEYLNQICDFEYLDIDDCNFAAIKK